MLMILSSMIVTSVRAGGSGRRATSAASLTVRPRRRRTPSAWWTSASAGAWPSRVAHDTQQRAPGAIQRRPFVADGQAAALHAAPDVALGERAERREHYVVAEVPAHDQPGPLGVPPGP